MLFFKKAFSILELIVIIAIIAGLFFIFVSSFRKMNKNTTLESSVSQSVFVLNKAKSMTLSSKEDKQYGVHIENNRMILFSGSIYNEFEMSNKEFLFDNDISITNIFLNGGGVDIIFKKLTGETDNYGSFNIYSSFDSSNIKIITIEQTGIVKKN